MRKRGVFYRVGQSTVEYAVILAVVAAAIVAMQIYFKRSLQGRIKDLADQVGQQYERGGTASNYSTTQKSETREQYNGSISSVQQNETMKRIGHEETAQNYGTGL